MASIEKRDRPRGITWRVIWREGKDKRSSTFHTEKGAKDWKHLIESVKGDSEEADRLLAKKKSQAPTVSEVSTARLDLLRASAFTKQTYQGYMKNHIGPAMGDWPIDQVTEDDCRRFVISLEEKPLGAKMISHVCGWLVSVLKHADDRGHRQGVPMKPDMLPKVKRTDADEENMFLTRKEAQSIIKNIKSQKYRDVCALLLATGLRPSELRALQVRDVTITDKRQAIRVSKAIRQNRETGEYIGPPKSELSDRRVGMPPSAAEMLVGYVKDRSGDERLFPGARKDWMASTTISKAFRDAAELAKEAGELDRDPDLYSLRHTHASLMLDAGMSTWDLSRHLGHDEAMTRTIYGHLLPHAEFKASQYAAAALGETSSDSPAAIES